MTDAGMGQSTCVGIGGDPIVGTSFIDVLDMFNRDRQNRGDRDDRRDRRREGGRAAAFVEREVRKPMAAFIAGRTAPPGRRMGHAGAIISGGVGTAESKRQALEAAGVRVADSPSHIPALLRDQGVANWTPLGGLPLVVQDRHQDGVFEAVRAAPRLAHQAFVLKTRASQERMARAFDEYAVSHTRFRPTAVNAKRSKMRSASVPKPAPMWSRSMKIASSALPCQ